MGLMCKTCWKTSGKEIGRDTILEPIIINLQETDSDNEETDADEETDESDWGSVCDDNIDEDEPAFSLE